MIKYTFIIPVKEINDYIYESIPKILEINRNDFEIIIYPDKKTGDVWPKTKQIPTKHMGPAQKRNLASKNAKGGILVFLDDDAYPKKDFLDTLDENFKDMKVSAVGGPAITPPNSEFWQKVSGAVFLSPLSSGCPERYIPIGRKRLVDDWPSVNLSIKKDIFDELKGFDCSYWPGEDTKLCLDLIEKTGKKILYNPNLIVHHHRRKGLIKHLRQIGGYGLHRGFFAKKYPKTSLKLKYFIPSLFLLFITGGAILSFHHPLFLKFYLIGWILYLLALIKVSWDIYKYEKNKLIILNSLYYVFFTHIFYGLRFVQGLIFTKNLKSKLR